MGRRIQFLIVGTVVVGATIFAVRFLQKNRSSADVTTASQCPAGSQCFDTAEALKGSGDNQAVVSKDKDGADEVTVDASGIRLATVASKNQFPTGTLPPNDTLPPDSSGGSTQPAPTPVQAPVQLSPTAELKYQLMDKFGIAFTYSYSCTPGLRKIDLPAFSTITADPALLASILKHTGIANSGQWSALEQQMIIIDAIRLDTLQLTPVSGQDGTYGFTGAFKKIDKTGSAFAPTDGQAITGTIQADGSITTTVT